MSAENDDFIRRRIYDSSSDDGEGSPLHQKSLSQLWAAVLDSTDEAVQKPSSGVDRFGERISKETNEQ